MKDDMSDKLIREDFQNVELQDSLITGSRMPSRAITKALCLIGEVLVDIRDELAVRVRRTCPTYEGKGHAWGYRGKLPFWATIHDYHEEDLRLCSVCRGEKTVEIRP